MGLFSTRSLFLAASLAAAAAAAAAGAAIAADAPLAEISGKISRVEKDAFELALKPNPYMVSMADDTVIVVDTPTTLDRVPVGTVAHVLGLKQADAAAKAGKNTGKEGHHEGGQIGDIQAIVIGDGFVAGELDAASAAKKRVWIEGTIGIDGKGYSLDAAHLAIEKKDYPVTQLVKSDRAALVSGKHVIVAGAESGDAKAKTMAAKRVRVLAATGAEAAADHVHVSGKITSVGADGVLEVSIKGSTYEVALATTATPVVVHTARRLGEIADGTPAHLVAFQDTGADHKDKAKGGGGKGGGGGANGPPPVSNVLVIVAGASFMPGTLDPGFAQSQKVDWVMGDITKGSNGMELNGAPIQCPLEKPAIVIGDGDASALAKGKQIIIDGVRVGDSKSKKITATRIDVMAPEIPAGDYKIAFGL